MNRTLRPSVCAVQCRKGAKHQKHKIMQISSVNNISYQPAEGAQSFAKIKQAFQKLGSSLESGNLADAKEALAQLQKNAPKQSGQDSNPMSAKLDALSKAVDSGDLKAAQDAYADVKKTMSERPSGGGRSGRAGGPPPGGAPPSGSPPSGASKSSSTASSLSSNKVYDAKDTNKDGTVSQQEEYDYSQAHPEATSKAAVSAQIDSGSLNVTA